MIATNTANLDIMFAYASPKRTLRVFFVASSLTTWPGKTIRMKAHMGKNFPQIPRFALYMQNFCRGVGIRNHCTFMKHALFFWDGNRRRLSHGEQQDIELFLKSINLICSRNLCSLAILYCISNPLVSRALTKKRILPPHELHVSMIKNFF